MESKNVYEKDSLKNLQVGDVFKFNTIGKYFTVYNVTNEEIYYNNTFRKQRTYKKPISEREVLIFPNRKREIRR